MLDVLIKVNQTLKECYPILSIVYETLQVNGYQVMQSELVNKMIQLNKAIDELNAAVSKVKG